MPTAVAHSDTSLVLDSDIFTHARKKHDYVTREFRSYFDQLNKFPALTTITLFEGLWGLESEIFRREITAESGQFYHRRIDELANAQEVLPLNEEAARIAAYIYGRLSQSDRNKHKYDIFIAAIALAHNHGVATRNRRDFELIGQHIPENYTLQLALWKP